MRLSPSAVCFVAIPAVLFVHAVFESRPLASQDPSEPIRHANRSAALEQCVDCHTEQVASFQRTTHARLRGAKAVSCESCHGDASKHVEEGPEDAPMASLASLGPKEVSETCLACHEIDRSLHYARVGPHTAAGVSCIDCHNVHPKNNRASVAASATHDGMLRSPQKELCLGCHTTVAHEFSFPKRHRLREGLLECSSCHNPHGSTSDGSLRADEIATCTTCHQDKRGPFAFRHDAMALDGCTSCHLPHGSINPFMLRQRQERALCISCHSREGAAGIPHSRLSLQATGDCTRCHTQIHGSNSSEFFLN